MGKTMKFKFQNKREVFLIHENSEKQELWGEPGWDDQDYHPSSKPAWEDWEIHTPPTELVEDDQKIPNFITNTVWEDLEIVYPTSEDTVPVPPTPPKKIKKVWRKKNKTSSTATTSPGTDEMTSIWLGIEKGPAFRTLNQELAWGRFPPLSQLYPLFAFWIKFDKNFLKKINIYCFISLFVIRGKNCNTLI